MENKKLIKLATRAGRIILESGGETYRVEETINRLLASFGAASAESFVTPTGIMVSMTDAQGEIVSLIERITKSTPDLEKVSRINDLSRRVSQGGVTVAQFESELSEIDAKSTYSIRMQLLMAALCCTSFTLLFGGNALDGAIALMISPGVRLIQILARSIRLNSIFINILGSAFVAAMALLLTHLLPYPSHLDSIIIGSITLLLPGIAFTNSIRDTLMGDFLSGVARGLEAFLIAAGIAIGAGLVFSLMDLVTGGVL